MTSVCQKDYSLIVIQLRRTKYNLMTLIACYCRVSTRLSAGINLAKKAGIYKGRQRGTTKGKPERAKELKSQGFSVEEIANAMRISRRTVFRYLSQE